MWKIKIKSRELGMVVVACVLLSGEASAEDCNGVQIRTERPVSVNFVRLSPGTTVTSGSDGPTCQGNDEKSMGPTCYVEVQQTDTRQTLCVFKVHMKFCSDTVASSSMPTAVPYGSYRTYPSCKQYRLKIRAPHSSSSTQQIGPTRVGSVTFSLPANK